MSGNDKGSSGPPTNCQNPEADCYRTPTRMVRWTEDHTAEDPRWSGWLCDPCWQMVWQGTKLSPNETQVLRLLRTDSDHSGGS